MKVKLLIPICCPDGSFKLGEMPDLTDTIALGLINGGYAELLEKQAQLTAEEIKVDQMVAAAEIMFSKPKPKPKAETKKTNSKAKP